MKRLRNDHQEIAKEKYQKLLKDVAHSLLNVDVSNIEKVIESQMDKFAELVALRKFLLTFPKS